jgi:hypothetical protein
MIAGKCHLCDQIRDLRDSHVWPKFAYKRFAADQSKGGRCADLSKQRLSNEQYTRDWFCGECEQSMAVNEKYAAEFCSRIESDRTSDQSYDGRLLRFATSISWRTLKYHTEEVHRGAIRSRWIAYDYWKRYLRGTRSGINPCTQHVYVMTDNNSGGELAVGGTIYAHQSLILSQIGPLLIVGKLGQQSLSASEERIWQMSKLRGTGGALKVVDLSRTEGIANKHEVTREFARIIGGFDAEKRRRIATMNLGHAKQES